MKKTLAKALSILLVLIMVLGAMPVSAIGEGLRGGRDFGGIGGIFDDLGDWLIQPRPGFSNSKYPAQTITGSADGGIFVTVDAPKGALPGGTTMEVVAITDMDAVQAAVDQTENVSGTVLTAVDITFLCGGREVQPKKDVTVTIASDALAGMENLSVVHLDVSADELDGSEDAEPIENVETVNESVSFSARHFSVYAVIGDGTDTIHFVTVTFFDQDGTTVINKQKIRMDKIAEMNPIVYDPGVPSITANQAFTGWGTSVPGDTYTEDSGITVEEINTYISENYGNWTQDMELNYIAQVFEVVFIFYTDQYGAVYKTEVKGRGEPFTYANDYVAEGEDNASVGVVGWVRYNDHTYVEKEGVEKTLPVYTDAAPAEAALHVPGETDTANGELILFPYITEGNWVQFDANYKDTADKDTRATFTSPRFVSKGGTLNKPTDPTRLGYDLEGWYTDKACTTRFNFTGETGATVVNAPMTLYAKWTAQQVTFHYVIWTQKADDAFDMDNDPQIGQSSSNATTATYTDTDNDYDYKDASGLTGYVATGIATAGTYLTSLSANTNLGGTESSALGYYYLYNGAKTRQELAKTVIKGDGSTVIGVYYDRKVMTFRFGAGTEKYYQVANPDWVNYGYYVKSGSAYYYSFYDSDTDYYYTQLIGNSSTSNTYYVIYNGTICPLTYYSYGGYWRFRYNGTYYEYSSGAVYTRSISAPSTVYAKAAELTSSNVDYTRRGLYGAQIDPSGTEWPPATTNYTWANYDPMVGSVFLYPLNLTEYVPTWQNSGVTTSMDFYETAYSGDKITVKYVGQTLNNNNTYTQLLATGTSHTNSHWYPTETVQGFTVYGYAYSSSSTPPTSWNKPITQDSQIEVADGETRNLYIAFTRNNYKLTFYSQGSELTSLSKSAVPYQTVLSAYKPAAADEPTSGPYGQYFTKWYADPDCKVEFDWSGEMPAHDVAVYAGWTDEWYRLVFDVTGNGKVPANTVTVPDGQAVSFTLGYGQKVESTALNGITTSVPGYIFGGWYYDTNFENQFNMNTEMNPDLINLDKTYKDSAKTGTDAKGNSWDDSPYPDVRNKITLYARWLKKVAGASGVSVIYDAVEGKGIIRSPYPEEVIKPDPILYTNGATAFGRYAATPIDAQGNNDSTRQFLYWEIRDTEGNVLRKVYPGQPFPIDINWAQETQSFEITWNYAKADGTMTSDTTKVAEGMRPTHATPASYQDSQGNHIFDHWDPEVVYAEADAEYTAVYRVVETQYFTVTFDMNGTTESQQVVEGGYPTVPSTINVPSGKRFIGWYMNDGTTLMSNEEVAATAISAATTFTAQYEDAGYTVTFNANGGTFTSGTTVVYENIASGKKLTELFPTTNPTNSNTVTIDGEEENLYFYGWFTDSTGGTQIASTDTVTGDVTVYAHWCTASWEYDNSGTLVAGDMYSFDIKSTSGSGYSLGVGTAGSYLRSSTTSSSVPSDQRWTAVQDSNGMHLAHVSGGSNYYIYNNNGEGYTSTTQSSASVITLSYAASNNGNYRYYIKSGSKYLNYTSSSSYTSWFIWGSSASTYYAVYHYQVVDQNAGTKGASSLGLKSNELSEGPEATKQAAETTRAAGDTYELVTSAPSDWSGEYVITNGNTNSMYVFKGVSGTSNGTNIEATSNASTFANAGITLSGNTLSNVGDGYVFVVEKQGDYYSVKNSSTGAYIGCNGTALYAYTTYAATTRDWTLSATSGMQSRNSGTYTHFGFRTSNSYFWVDSSADSTIRFWKKTSSTPATPCTVTYMANGEQVGTASATVGGTVTLPSTAAAPTGYTFAGWVTSTLDETTTAPTYYAPGAVSPALTGDTTFYALYTRTEGESATVYELVTSQLSSYAGNYVITYGKTAEDIIAMHSVTGGSSYESDTSGGAVAFANTGMTLNGNTLSGVANEYVFTFETRGSYYSIKNAANNTYLGRNVTSTSNSATLQSYSSYSSTFCRWTPSYSTQSNTLIFNYNTNSSYDSSYKYIGAKVSGPLFWVTGPGENDDSDAYGIQIWKETATQATTYYTTGASTFTVTWKDANGSVIETDPGVEPGSHPSFDGTNPTKPADGTYTYTFAGWKVEGTSGNTTVDLSTYTVTGNVTFVPVFTATEIPTVTYTVTYKSNGTTVGTDTVAEGGTVTLPATLSSVPEGYTFVGWIGRTVEETSTAPTYYAKGAQSPEINSDTTFHALFTRIEGGTTETVFELLTAVPEEVPGVYVISSGSTSASYMLTSIESGDYENSSYKTLISTSGATISTENGKTIMRDVPAANQFTFGTRSGVTDGYTIVNNDGSYLYIASPSSANAYYLAARTSYTNTYSLWNINEYSDGVFHVGTYADSDRSFHYSSNVSRFGLYSISGNEGTAIGVQLWKQTEITTGTTYYTTTVENLYTLTINYVVPAGYTAPEAYVGYYGEGDTYTVESPEVEGCNVETGKETVTGTMPASDLTLTVTYTAKPTYTVTVTYVGPNDGTFVAPPNASVTVVDGETYSIGSPEVYGYEPDIDIVSGTINGDNVNVTVTYSKLDIGDKTYTITLYAVYGRANTDGRTHVYWYTNDDTATETYGGWQQQDIVDINTAFDIPTPTNFLAGTINHGTRDTSSGTQRNIEWEDHIFLGWARVEDPTNSDTTGKAHHELNEDDLYLRWTGTGYQVYANKTDGWVDVTQVAADEMRPYHDMYAVWADVFYVYHSGSKAVQRVVRTTKAATYDLTAELTNGTLYGGYYSDYTGKSNNFAAKELAWASTVTATQLRNGLFAENKSDDPGTVYDGTNKMWNAAAVYMNPGNTLVPEAGKTYYIKEVPADKYLRPYLHYTYYGVENEGTITGTGKIASLYAISDIDDLLYFDTGFIITEKGSNSAHIVKSLTIKPANNQDNGVTLTAEELFGVGSTSATSNRLTYLKLYDESASSNIVSAGNSFTVSRYWKTPDGLYVTGVVTTTYAGTNSVYSITGTDVTGNSLISANVNSIVSALAAN